MLQMLSHNQPKIPSYHDAVADHGLASAEIFDQYALEAYEKNAGEILYKIIGKEGLETKIDFESDEIKSENYEGIIPFLVEGNYIRILSLHLPFYVYLEITEKGYDKRSEYIESIIAHEHQNLINEAMDLHARMANLIGATAAVSEEQPEKEPEEALEDEGLSQEEKETSDADNLYFNVDEEAASKPEEELVIFGQGESLTPVDNAFEGDSSEEDASEEDASEDDDSEDKEVLIKEAPEIENSSNHADIAEDDDRDDGIEVIMPADYNELSVLNAEDEDDEEEYRPVTLSENNEIIELMPADIVDDRDSNEDDIKESKTDEETKEDLEAEKASYEEFEEHEHHHQEVVTSSSDDHTLEAFGLDSLKRDEELLHEAAQMPRIKPPGDYYLKPIPNVSGNIPLNPDHITDDASEDDSAEMEPDKVRERIMQNIKEQEFLDAKERDSTVKKDDKSFDWPDSQ